MSRNLMLSLVGALAAFVLLASCSSDTAGPNRAPVANAGPDLVRDVGTIVDLDGSASFDPDDDKLSFQWNVLSGPNGAQTEIGEPGAEHASLVPDTAGVWMIGLVVTDARGLASEPDVMQLRAMSTKCELDDDCNDGVACTANHCNTSTGTCEYTPDDSLCPDDGNFCNGTEYCDGNIGCGHTGDPCAATSQLCDATGERCVDCQTDGDCDDGIACTDDNCADGNCVITPDNGKCPDDGVFCNGPEICDAQAGCQSGGDPCPAQGLICDEAGRECRTCSQDGDCNDSVACTTDSCDAGTCIFTPDDNACPDDGDFCNGTEICDRQTGCVGNGDPCAGSGQLCDTAGGRCVDCLADGDCNDGVTCTDDACDNLTGMCASIANDANCDDGAWCNGSETCDALQGCLPGTAPDCDDGVSCTDDGCNEGTDSCDHPPNDSLCTDGNICTTNTCDALADCQTNDNDGAACTVAGCTSTCLGGLCDGCTCGNASDCDDGVACTVDDCAGGMCTNVPSNALCDDGAWCNGPETCDAQQGCQAGAAPNCDDGVACTGDSCNEVTDKCDNLVNDTNCDDGTWCNGPERCDAVLDCQAGLAPDCDDGVSCTDDSCNEGTDGCDNPANNANCDDGAWCNGPETCDAQQGCQVGAAPNCDDGVVCTDDSCNEGTNGCNNPANDANCDDDSWCNGAERCDSVLGCQAGAGNPCSGPDGDGDCAESCDDVADNCLGNDPNGEACDDGDFCTLGDACDGFGVCDPGTGQKDNDGDSYVDLDCGGNDCDDDDVFVNPGMSEGPVCDALATCYDGKDNECDTFTDGADSDCQAVNFICLDGPAGQVPLGAPGDTLTVRLDGAGYDPSLIVCYTDNARLISPVQMFANDFESDLNGFSVSDSDRVFRWNGAQNPNTLGSRGVAICSGDDWLMTDAIDTTGRTRIRLRYAARSWSLDNDELFITEYSPNDGGNWYVLDIQGDNYRDNVYQWFTHILPPRCENITNLRIRFRVRGGDNSDCALVDDVSLYDLPDPTVSWTLLSNHFEAAEGNSTADDCDGETIVHFWDQGNTDGEICLLTSAQNPANTSSENLQGVRIVDDDPSYLDDPDVNTRLVPPGSDLVAGFWMQELNIGNGSYANAWYFDGSQWYRMNGVGSDTTVDYDWFRFIWEQSAIGSPDAQVSFEIPSESPMNNGQGIYLDDYDLSWHRASHDIIGPFSNQGDGTYTANIQSDLTGNANVMCIFYGAPPLVTDGLGDNSGSFPMDFGP
ncbi:MAG TPA: hypothetical protein VM425_10115 [Myxococcota bacterium]|nr:hypothetical protein [Myxococcota bacterium]